MGYTALVDKLSGSLLTIISLLTFVGFVVWTVNAGQDKAQDNHENLLLQRDYDPKDPVKIVNVSSEHKPIRLDEKFKGGADWLRTTQIRLKNVSNNEVVYIRLEFIFPETKSSGHEMSFVSELGNMPGMPVLNSPLSLKPLEEVSFSFSQDEYQNLVKLVGSRTNISKLKKTDLKIGFVVFADSSAWGTGLWFKPNPNKPRSWIPVTPQPPN